MWRSIKHEEIHLRASDSVGEAEAGIAARIAFYNTRRFHQAVGNRTPMLVWRGGMVAAAASRAGAAEMMDNAAALDHIPTAAGANGLFGCIIGKADERAISNRQTGVAGPADEAHFTSRRTRQDKMRRETPFFSFVPALQRASAIPILRQLYALLRDAIITGALQGGERLPSTRLAALEWQISRGVVTEAYDMLIAEGFAFGRHGSGTYVSPDLGPVMRRGHVQAEAQAITPRRTVSQGASDVVRFRHGFADFEQMPFVTGRVVHDDRTARILKRLASRHLDFREDGYGPSQGEASTREAIARHLSISRGVKCEPEQVFVTSGTQQAIDIITRVLVTPGRSVLVEDPCYPSTLHTLLVNGVVPVNMEIDESGVVTDRLLSLDGDYAAIYVTPSHQYPAGGALPLARRLELLTFAHARGSWIIEDDYDSEFRYEGPSLTALQGLDENGSVIYVGTFSKALLPSLRVGYFVAPREVLNVFQAVRPAMDRFPPRFQQRLITDFLNGGYFPAHLRRLRETYRASRDCLVNLLRERCACHLNVAVPAQGIHLTATSTGTWRDDVALAEVARREGVVVIPVSPMMRSRKTDRLILGFSGLREGDADVGTMRLADALRRTERLAPPPAQS